MFQAEDGKESYDQDGLVVVAACWWLRGWKGGMGFWMVWLEGEDAIFVRTRDGGMGCCCAGLSRRVTREGTWGKNIVDFTSEDK